jgi:hypothetical protein
MNNILKNIVKIANIPENETKRMKRKHLFQKLKDKIVPDENAIHITGHKHYSLHFQLGPAHFGGRR